MAAVVRSVATELEVPVLVCLEGGYALGALAGSAVATLEELSGDRQAPAASLEPAAPYRERLARYWPALG
jgi:acetoin utilization deacetylase AcuC-like enzyme